MHLGKIDRIEPFEKYSHLYMDWFKENKYAYKFDLEAIRKLIPELHVGSEIRAFRTTALTSLR